MTEANTANRPLRVALAAGGTGGHLMPALATAEAIERRSECEFVVIGSERDSERAMRGLVPYPVVELRVRGIAGTGPLRGLLGLATLPRSIAAARRHLKQIQPHLVIATGGFVCGPTGIAARLLGIPLLVLEQNATPGMTTRWLRHVADGIGVSFARTATQLGPRSVVTGNPIRGVLPAARSRSGEPHPTATGALHLLILGGSQGAHGLNTMVRLAIPLLAEADVGLRVIHQTGTRDLETLREAWAAHGIPATVAPFITNMGEAYARANVVCSRAGATTIAELAYCGLPSLLVPLPTAAGRHQHANAAALVDAGAAIVVEQEVHGRPLADAIVSLATDPSALPTMAAAAAALGRDDAAGAVAGMALDLALPRAPSGAENPGSDDDPALRVSEAP